MMMTYEDLEALVWVGALSPLLVLGVRVVVLWGFSLLRRWTL